MEKADVGNVALSLVTALAVKLKARELIDINQVEERFRIRLEQLSSETEKEAVMIALQIIRNLK